MIFHVSCASFWTKMAHANTKLVPSWPKLDPNWLQVGTSWLSLAQVGANFAEADTKLTQTDAKLAPISRKLAKLDRVGGNLTQNRSRTKRVNASVWFSVSNGITLSFSVRTLTSACTDLILIFEAPQTDLKITLKRGLTVPYTKA